MSHLLRRTCGLAFVVALGAVAPSHAASTLTTAPALRGGRGFCCNVTNASSLSVGVDVGIRDLAGAPPLADLIVPLGPRHGVSHCIAAADGPANLYCSVVFTGDPKRVRASACVQAANGACAAIEAAR